MLLLAFGAAVFGCQKYADRVSCSSGTVLDENDQCVPPPVPDGGVTVSTCAELCDLVASWSTTQVECLQASLGAAGPPPAECMADLTDVASCNACVGATGAPDSSCATAGALCQ
jgi:hypothetical protein